MVSPDVIRNIVGIVGNVTSFVLFITPVRTFRNIIKNKDVEGFSLDPYLAMLLNCMFWVFYGLPVVHPKSMLVVTVNRIGLLIQATYLAIFFVLASSKKRRRMLLVLSVEAVFMAASVLGVLLGAHTHGVRSMIVGQLCVIASSVMYASPLTVMGEVTKTKSVECMPLFLSILGLLDGACWTAYALIQFDIYIMIPNGLGVLFSLAQLTLYVHYYKSTPEKDKNV